MTSRWTIESLRAPPFDADRWVVRFGGSLLTWPGWPEALLDLVDRLSGTATIVVGGGPIVDGLREVDAAHPLPAELTHSLAIEAMGITARLVAAAAGLPVVDVPQAGPGAAVLDAPRWLANSARGSRLPAGWGVTSDSIAATVALEAAATLVLAKRVPPPATNLLDLAAAEWVDAHMPALATDLAGILWAVPRDGAE